MKKDFDLDAAKRGATVCTRGGNPVRILCFDAKRSNTDEYRPIVVEELTPLGHYSIITLFDNGRMWKIGKSDYDLMMADDDYLEKLERGEYGKTDHIGDPTEKVGWDYWRRMYAGMAMQAFITSDPQELTLSHAESAVVAADALIEKLKKQPDPKI